MADEMKLLVLLVGKVWVPERYGSDFSALKCLSSLVLEREE